METFSLAQVTCMKLEQQLEAHRTARDADKVEAGARMEQLAVACDAELRRGQRQPLGTLANGKQLRMHWEACELEP